MARRDITLSVDIAAPVETVWGVVTDWESQGDWMLGTGVRVTRGDGASVGSELAATTGVGPLGVAERLGAADAGARPGAEAPVARDTGKHDVVEVA